MIKNKIFNIKKEKKNKSKKKTHDANSKDNIRQSIIRHFINFLLNFINLVVNKIINTQYTNKKEIKFKISYKVKESIKVKDIVGLNVENILLFSPIKNEKNGMIMNNEIKTPNQKELIEIRKIIGSSLDLFFETKVIDIFKEIYCQKEKIIDLKKYGIEGININLNKFKNIQNYQRLRKKTKKNKEKLRNMDFIIDNEFINHNIQKKIRRKRIRFSINKKDLIHN